MPSLKLIFDVRPGEKAKTLFMAGYFFLTIALVYILKPIRTSLFLEDHGADNLRYAYMAEGVFLILVVWAYIQLSRLIPKKLFFPAILFFFTLNLGIFWFLIKTNVPYVSGFFYVWADSFTITMTTQFWLLANAIFTTEQAKRLFGIVISAGSLGGVAGGFLTSHAVKWIATEELLLVAAGIVGLCVLLTLATESMEFKSNYDEFTAGHADPEAPESGDSVFTIFAKNPYLIYLTLLVLLAKIASTVVDNQFSAGVEAAITGKEARTAFFGSFMAWLNIVSFLMQLLATGPLLRRFGTGVLWILPAGLLAFCVGGIFYPLFVLVMAWRVFDGSVNYSIQQAAKEMLFLPIPGALRPRVKPVIDMLGFRLAKSIGGVFITAGSAAFGLQNHQVGFLTLGLVPVWFIVLGALKKEQPRFLEHHSLNQNAEGI